MLAWNEREGFIQVLAQFIKRARLAGVVAGGLNAATAKCPAFLLKSADVVALPAVQRDGNRFESFQGRFSIDAPRGVDLLCREILFVVHSFCIVQSEDGNSKPPVLRGAAYAPPPGGV